MCHGSFGQDKQDSTSTVIVQGDSLLISGDQNIEEVFDTLENRPNTAALYSAALPGLGQAYNGMYWKIPVIYGGGLVLGYYINYNHQLYKQYRDGLYALIDGDDRTVPIFPDLDKDDYQRQVDYWRRNRDLLFVTAILVYVLNIVDAHVDAHMQLFTVDDDISVKLEPSFSQTAMQTNLIGLSLKLRFN
jgi:hypothetical protein